MHELTERFVAAVPDAPTDLAHAAAADLLTRWAEPARHYHTIAHLSAVLTLVDAEADLADDADAVRLGAWFHDAVYDPTAADNEERSADLAASMLADLGVEAATVGEVRRLVLLTRAHDPAPDDRSGTLLSDADLAILAAPPEQYRAYAQAVRREYAHVPEPLFRAGRAGILRQLLDGGDLYRTSRLRERFEAAARANLAAELADLES